MSSDRKRELAYRIQANNQRQSREELLSQVPPELVDPIARAECIYSPMADPLVRRAILIHAAGRRGTPHADLDGYMFEVSGWPTKVAEILTSIGSNFAFEPAFLVLEGGDYLHLRDETISVSRLPLFRMRYREARKVLAALWRPLFGFSGVFLESFAAGVLVDSFAEYPESNPGPAECTYEIAAWEPD